jgi:hypothetical protein
MQREGNAMPSQQVANKRRGAAWEIDLADFFMQQGLNAQRLPRAGRNDIGDVFVPGVNGIYVVEAKAPRRDGRIDLSGWIRESEIEAENYRVAKRLTVAPTPLVIIKASNKGTGEAYVVLPGANNWKPFYSRVLADWEKIMLFCDGDNAGKEMAKTLSRELDNVFPVFMPDNCDVNDVFLTEGAEGLRKRVGV